MPRYSSPDGYIEKKHWQAALDVQSACNLSGVVYSFNEAMDAICGEARLRGKGTDWKNSHPISVLFSAAIGNITKTCTFSDHEVYSKAYEAAQKEVSDA